ncbi:ATP-binding protein [Streptomyces fungicidicus]|uniref:ATP-binding protein n=1 Tax=Streptomyces fungicidicus TaxID=68203 RepID=UPI00384FD3BF
MAVHAAAVLSQVSAIENPLPSTEQGTARNAGLTPPVPLDWGLALGISTADFVARSFTRDPGSLKSIRRFIRETISAWGLTALADDLTAAVNELTTNAVQHALAAPGGAHERAWLGMTRTGNTVMCAVADPSPTPPSRRRPACMADAGRGLAVVDALTDQWGYTATAPGGKAVWVRISAPI